MITKSCWFGTEILIAVLLTSFQMESTIYWQNALAGQCVSNIIRLAETSRNALQSAKDWWIVIIGAGQWTSRSTIRKSCISTASFGSNSSFGQ